MARRCVVCGDPYYRRNLIEGWTTRNPGHRKGWKKSVAQVCLGCQTPTQTQRLFLVLPTRRRRNRRVA